MTNGNKYIITSLGNTNNTTWSNMAGTSLTQWSGTTFNASHTKYSIGTLITITSQNTSAGTGTGRLVTGKGTHLNKEGDLLVGDIATDKFMYFDEDIGALVLRGAIADSLNGITFREGSNQQIAIGAHPSTQPQNHCVLLGYSANGYGYGNTSLGNGAGSWIGHGATNGASGEDESENTCVGYEAGYHITTGKQNVFLGAQAGRGGTSSTQYKTGYGNIGIGGSANIDSSGAGHGIFSKLSSGNKNIAIGWKAGISLTTGDGNIMIGANAQVASATGDNQLKLGGWITGDSSWNITVTGTATATTFSGSGASLTSLNASSISSGTIAAARVPTLNQSTTGTAAGLTGSPNITVGTIASGTISVTGSITASANITAYSDERLKSDIKTLDGKKVLEMRGVEYIRDGEKGSGVIAQELEKIAPELVQDGEYKSVAYGNITGYLIEAIKTQQQEINELKDLVTQLLEK
jgi:hypothetical protein